MMYSDLLRTAPQGWQCPICGRVYSPTTPMCWYCNTGTTDTTSTGTYKVEWGHIDTKTEGGNVDAPKTD